MPPFNIILKEFIFIRKFSYTLLLLSSFYFFWLYMLFLLGDAGKLHIENTYTYKKNSRFKD